MWSTETPPVYVGQAQGSVCVDSQGLLLKVLGNTSKQQSQLHWNSGEGQNTPPGVITVPHSISHHGPLGGIPTSGGTDCDRAVVQCVEYKPGWEDFLVAPILLPLVHANIFTLLALPRAGQCSQHSFPCQHGEGREAEHPCCGTRSWALVEDAWRCPGHPDPQFWQRRSLSAAAPRKLPPQDCSRALGPGWVWWDSGTAWQSLAQRVKPCWGSDLHLLPPQ